MTPGKALTTAPLVVFPVALAFILLPALVTGDIRELITSPISAAVTTLVGYPFALAGEWLAWRILKGQAAISLWKLLAAGLIWAESVFWLIISPLWERSFSALFCLALVGACGLACGGVLYRLLSSSSLENPKAHVMD